MDINTGLLKLNSLLPLAKRQLSLQPEHRLIHQDILYTLASNGVVKKDIDPTALKILENNDLVVLDSTKTTVVGAYPFSLRATAHRVVTDAMDVFAMCAFDAVSIAPVFGLNTTILSSCHISHDNIRIQQSSNKLITAEPGADIFIGIRWQAAGTCAADNLCMEMIFLRDKSTARDWKEQHASASIFPLPGAIEFSKKYFQPLLEN